jgi:hypothetical protein
MPDEDNMGLRIAYGIKRDEPVTAREIEDLREAVGWERLENKYENFYRGCGFYIFMAGIIDNHAVQITPEA